MASELTEDQRSQWIQMTHPIPLSWETSTPVLFWVRWSIFKFKPFSIPFYPSWKVTHLVVNTTPYWWKLLKRIKYKTCCRLFQKYLVKDIYQRSTYKMQIAGDEVIFHKAHYQNSSKHIYVYAAILNPLLILDPDAPHKNIKINT